MQKKTHVRLSLLLGSLTLSLSAHADTLMQVYQQGLATDPTFQQAEADWASAKQDLPINRSYTLPTLEFTDGLGKIKKKRPSGSTKTNTYHVYALTLTQPILDFYDWRGVSLAKAEVKSATATYLYAGQTLIQRVAKVYFKILEDIATLKNTTASKKQYERQLKTNKEKFNVGLIPVTDVYNAEANYDAAEAQEISDKNTLQSDLEALTAITNKHYKVVTGIKDDVPLVMPIPNNITQWETIAKKQNFDLKAAQYSTQQYKENIGYQASQMYPKIDATGSINYSRNSTTAKHSYSPDLDLTFLPYQGGLVKSQTKQAQYDYQSYQAQQEATLRLVTQNTKTDFLNINANIESIKANKKAITSAEESYKATEAGYSVGTKTLEDVLTTISTLYGAKQSYTESQYDYLYSIISLKLDAGTLSVDDLMTIDQWLSQNYSIIPLLNTSEMPSTKKTPSKKTTPNKTTAQYAIQIFASQSEAEAQHLINQVDPKKSTYHIQHTSPWYKVVSRPYTTLTAAQKSLQSIKLRQPNAWILTQ